MRIEYVKLINFRNYQNDTVYFGSKAIIVGSNDSGKTNLLYAIRLILDDNIPESQMTPAIHDFNFYSNKSRFDIIVKFCSINEECILAKMKGSVSEHGEMFIHMIGTYDYRTGKRDYGLYIGESEDNLAKIESRHYLRVMNLRYIESSRDLEKYIKKEKSWLLDKTKEERTEGEIEADEKNIQEINTCLGCLSEKVSDLHYVNKSTTLINNNIKKLSSRNSKKEVTFSTIETDSRVMIDRLALSAKESGHVFNLGGDGFANQTHLSLWASRNSILKKDEKLTSKVTIYCIEEIEAHLHPHHQRILAKFLHNYFENEQVIITTHSPQIASQFPPELIVCLRSDSKKTISFGNIKHEFHLKRLVDLGYRMNSISAELYFAEVAFFVEGPSEVMFYKLLSKMIDIDLDYYNISVIDVGGIGFHPYCALALSLGKKFVVRTDKDISKVPKKDIHKITGVLRGIKIVKTLFDADIFSHSEFEIKDLCWPGGKEDIPKSSIKAMYHAIKMLKKFNIFISETDLEHDLIHDTPFGIHVQEFFDAKDYDNAVKILQTQKAKNMFSLLSDKGSYLKELSDTSIAAPLYSAKNLADR